MIDLTRVALDEHRDFGTWLYYALYHERLTQTKLADDVGIAPNTVNKIAHHRVNPSLYTALLIAKAMGYRLVLEKVGGDDPAA